MEQSERLRIRSEMDQMFEAGDISQATPEDLQRFLRVSCTGNIPNETVHPREIVRGITINHVQMARTIKQLEDTMHRLNVANDQTPKLVIRLTWVAIAVGIIQAIAGVISIFRCPLSQALPARWHRSPTTRQSPLAARRPTEETPQRLSMR